MHWRDAAVDVAAIATAACAVLVTSAFFLRPSWLPVPGRNGAFEQAETPVSNWQDLLGSGFRIGPKTAALTLIEFGDFQCPFCRKYALTLDSVRTGHPEDFAIVFHNFPLSYHELAYTLAKAGVCAARQGRFEAYYDAAYRHQLDRPTLTPVDIGLAAGMPDTASYRACVRDTTPVPAIDRDIARARAIGAGGTPTIIVDGMRYARNPSASDLEAMVREHVRSQAHR